MTRLHFKYKMELEYKEPVSKCYFTIKCFPREDKRQRLLDMDIELYPETSYMKGKDSFGNKQIYGCEGMLHDRFCFTASGEVEIGQTEYTDLAVEEQIGIFRYPHGKCMPGEGILTYFKTITLAGCKNDYEKCLMIMENLHQTFSYAPNRTHMETTAEQAWNLKEGVCQDYAHIFITLLRLVGIPARYVCGFMTGEGESHAWVEAVCDGKWTAFDPTHNCLALENYIKLGHGRDAADCAINRGIMWGGGEQMQRISVLVEKIQ